MHSSALLLCSLFFCANAAEELYKPPTIIVSILARNKAHTLPYFLTLLEQLEYPKNRISLWIRSDHNTDKTLEILQKWLRSVENDYHSINTEFFNDEDNYTDETGPYHWSQLRFDNIIRLRETALNYARQMWADYILMIDCDVFLTNPHTLQYLIAKDKTVIAPLLKTDGMYSNFWHGMTEDYYYERTEDYKPVLNREKKGSFQVPMIHSCVLINLKKVESDLLTYNPSKISNYDGPKDDIITFAISANRSNIGLFLCNEEPFGYVMVPLEEHDGFHHDRQQLMNLKLEILNLEEGLHVTDPSLREYTDWPAKDTVRFDKIFMINLLRRPERRRRMLKCFDELGLDVTILEAVDGRALNESTLSRISFLPEYTDPYHKRSMTLGEIGCFLSHYNIWKEIVDKHYNEVLVLEDDIRFEPFFRVKVENLMDEVRRYHDWDLVYFGRKRLHDSDEPWVPNARHLVHAGYSYWTLGYALSLRGARKLLAADPLTRLVPVDEYLPILFDKHPQRAWSAHFPRRDLVALSAAPLLVYPTHYTGERGYVSDTEDSVIVAGDKARDDL